MYNQKNSRHYITLLLLIVVFITNGVICTASANKSPVNFLEIKKFAKFSKAAYFSESKIRSSRLLGSYNITHHGITKGSNVSYFIATNDADKTQIIAIRGTSNIENAMADAEFNLITNKHTGIRLHSGFSAASQQLYSEIRSKIKPEYTVNTTGHSLGGAIALILAMHLDVDKFKVGKVITFGQPKVTNIPGSSKFQHLDILRIVTPKDVVPLVPPFDIVDLDNIDIYWHSGKEIVLLENTKYSVLEGLNSMIRVTKFTQEPFNEKNLINHHMSLYMKLINKKIPAAKLVPFKNSFNLFNLFGS
jgi:triacylglycerol lipase